MLQALRSGLKALRALGINGICVDVYWGIVEGVRPREYDWSSYKQLFALIRDEGFMVQVRGAVGDGLDGRVKDVTGPGREGRGAARELRTRGALTTSVG